MDGRLQEFDKTSSSIVNSTVDTLSYPFIYLDGITAIELKTLSPKIQEGQFPLMVRFKSQYVKIGCIDINLHSILKLLKYSKRKVFIKEDATVEYPVEEVLPEMLLQSS